MEEEIQFGRMIKEISEHFEKQLNADLQKYNLTVAQFHLLLSLYLTEDGTATMKMMEKRLHAAQSTVAGLVVRLEKKQLICSFCDETDRRVKHLQITEAGKEVCFTARQSAEKSEQAMLADLSAEEKAQLYALMGKIHRVIL